MSSKTSARSPFWLTDRLGLTSQPTNSFGRGEIETVKHPSPSMYPKMSDPRSTSPHQEPASCPSHRFAIPQTVRQRCDRTGAYPQWDQSLRGHTAESGRGLPTASPAGSRLVLGRGSRVGIRRYERDWTYGITSIRGNCSPDKEFRSSCSPRRRGARTISSARHRSELVGVWPLRIPGTETAHAGSSAL